jgi:hypothetical protein
MVFSTQYFPQISWVQQFLTQNELQIAQLEKYQKQGFMNRCKIMGSGGVITLSVPIVGGRNQNTPINDVVINNSTKWQINHLRTLQSCYGKAPFFEYYYPSIEKLLLQPHTNLLALNNDILNLLIGWFKWNGTTSKIDYSVQNQYNKLTSIETPSYIQVFADRQAFVPNLSILDAIFCNSTIGI